MAANLRTITRVSLSAAVTALAIAASPEVFAQATAPYGCACLHNNKVSGTINYRFKWGSGAWKNVSMPAGGAHWMCWAYKDGPRSPELLFELDADMTSGTDWKTFSIKRAQSKEQNCNAIPAAAHYHVGYVEGTNKKKIRIFDGKS